MNEYDVVVMGSGGAGFAAALTAAMGGARVVVLERSPVFGGTTAISGAGMWLPLNSRAAEMGWEDSPEEVRTYLRRLAMGRTSEDLLDVFVDEAPNAFTMLAEEAGLEFASTMQPDYQTTFPGAKAGGRSIWPTLYDANRLGDLEPLVRDVPHPGGMPPVTFQELADSNWGLGEEGGAWAELAERRRQERVFGKGRALIAGLLEACASRGVELITDARVVGLDRTNGRVSGVEVLRGGTRERVGAKQGVVLASGGFEWNKQMWRDFVGVPLDGPMSVPWNEGDALRLAMGIGARVANLNEVWWMPGIAVPGETYDGQPRFRMGAAGKSLPGAIVVNQAGRRFVNESLNYNDFGHYQVRFDPSTYTFPNQSHWVVFDERHREKYPPIAYDPDRHYGEDWLVEAQSIGELADKLGIDRAGLEAQVHAFNENAEKGEDPQFLRGMDAYSTVGKFGDPTLKNPNLAPLTRAPFYGYKLAVSCLGTKGGPVIDRESRVVDNDNRPIEGLYAAGNAAAPVFGTAYPGGGSTIGAGVTFGYIAGKSLTSR